MEEFLARNSPFDDSAQRTAYEILVAVNSGAIEMAIANRRGTEDRLSNLLTGYPVGSKCPQANRRDLRARVQDPLRYTLRIHAVRSVGK
jgi:hypothetical protein